MNLEAYFKDKTLTVGSTFYDDINTYTISNMKLEGDVLTVFVQVKNHATQARSVATFEKTFAVREVEKIVEKIVEIPVPVPATEADAKPVSRKGRRK